MLKLTLKYSDLPEGNELSYFRLTKGAPEEGERGMQQVVGRWVSPGEAVSIHGIRIEGGLFYYKQGQFDDVDSRIDRSTVESGLGIKIPPAGHQNYYWGYDLSYRHMSERDRWSYLVWLASDRNPDAIDFDMLWIYIFGIERRLLIESGEQLESDEIRRLRDELLRLRKYFSESHRAAGKESSRQLTSLLCYIWMLYFPHDAPEESFTEGRLARSFFRYRLALDLERGSAISSEIAFEWLKRFSNFNFRKMKRARTDFARLFKLRYTEVYGEGMVLEETGPQLQIPIVPLNTTIGFYGGIRFDLFDRSKDKSLIRKLVKIANRCFSELSDYEKFLRRKVKVQSLSAFSRLPHSLAGLKTHKKAVALESWILGHSQFQQGSNSDSISYLQVPFEELMHLFEDEKFSNFSKRNIDFLDRVLDRIGFSIVPHPDVHSWKTKKSDEIFLLRARKTTSPMPYYILLIRLGLTFTGDEDVVVFLREEILANDRLASNAKLSLVAFLTWLESRAPRWVGLKAIRDQCTPSELDALRREVVRLATLKGGVDHGRLSSLEKIYTFLGLDKTLVIKDIHKVMASGRPISIRRGAGLLDHAVIEKKERQSEQAKNILSEIFHAEDIEEGEVEPNPGIGKGLNEKQKRFFAALQGQEEWSETEFKHMSKDLNMMLDGLIENINDWSFALTDNPLIEFDQSYYVDQDTLEELNQLAGGNNG